MSSVLPSEIPSPPPAVTTPQQVQCLNELERYAALMAEQEDREPSTAAPSVRSALGDAVFASSQGTEQEDMDLDRDKRRASEEAAEDSQSKPKCAKGEAKGDPKGSEQPVPSTPASTGKGRTAAPQTLPGQGQSGWRARLLRRKEPWTIDDDSGLRGNGATKRGGARTNEIIARASGRIAFTTETTPSSESWSKQWPASLFGWRTTRSSSIWTPSSSSSCRPRKRPRAGQSQLRCTRLLKRGTSRRSGASHPDATVEDNPFSLLPDVTAFQIARDGGEPGAAPEGQGTGTDRSAVLPVPHLEPGGEEVHQRTPWTRSITSMP